MNILVCIKQVYSPSFIEKPAGKGRSVTLRSNTEYRMNRFDEYALETALQIRETIGAAIVDVVTEGGKTASDVIKRALGMGADNGFHILNENLTESDATSVASRIAGFAQQKSYDLILTGIMSEDLMQAQTGQMMAEILGISSVSGIVSIEPEPSGSGVLVGKEKEGAVREMIRVAYPALFTVQAGINTPRYPSLSNILKADAKEITIIEPEIVAATQKTVRLYPPEKSRNGLFLEGTGAQKALQLYDILREKNFLKG